MARCTSFVVFCDFLHHVLTLLPGVSCVRRRRVLNSWWSNTNVILADEMGLGKTIQTIAFVRSILLERPLNEHRPCLVLCPLSTTDNWERELEGWCPDLNCVRFVGNVKSRTVALEVRESVVL